MTLRYLAFQYLLVSKCIAKVLVNLFWPVITNLSKVSLISLSATELFGNFGPIVTPTYFSEERMVLVLLLPPSDFKVRTVERSAI